MSAQLPAQLAVGYLPQPALLAQGAGLCWPCSTVLMLASALQEVLLQWGGWCWPCCTVLTPASFLQDVLLQWGGALQAVFTVFQLQVTDAPGSGAGFALSVCRLMS